MVLYWTNYAYLRPIYSMPIFGLSTVGFYSWNQGEVFQDPLFLGSSVSRLPGSWFYATGPWSGLGTDGRHWTQVSASHWGEEAFSLCSHSSLWLWPSSHMSEMATWPWTYHPQISLGDAVHCESSPRRTCPREPRKLPWGGWAHQVCATVVVFLPTGSDRFQWPLPVTAGIGTSGCRGCGSASPTGNSNSRRLDWTCVSRCCCSSNLMATCATVMAAHSDSAVFCATVMAALSDSAVCCANLMAARSNLMAARSSVSSMICASVAVNRIFSARISAWGNRQPHMKQPPGAP